MRALCAVALCAGWACSGEKDFIPESGLEGGEAGIPLRFGPGPVVRGAVFEGVSFAAGDELGVLGYSLPSTDGITPGTWSDSAVPDFMYNTRLTCQGASGFTYSPGRYWPANPNDKVRFFAYYPYAEQDRSSAVVLSAESASGFPTIVYTPDTVVSRQRDLMCAVTAPLDHTAGKVSFTFRHVLTQVGFSACYSGALPVGASLRVDSVRLGDVAGSMRGTFTGEGFLWSGVSLGAAGYTVREVTKDPVVPQPGKTAVCSSDGILLLIPQQTSGNPVVIYYSLVLPADLELHFTQEANLPSGQSWTPGGKVEYLLTITPQAGWTGGL